MTRQVSVATKVTGAFVMISLLVAGVSVSSLSATVAMGKEIFYSGEVTGKKALLCGQLQGYSAKMRGALRGAILYSGNDMHKPEVAARSAREYMQFADAVKQISLELDTMDGSAAERQAAALVRQSIDDWRPVAAGIIGSSAKGEFGSDLTALTMRSLQLADQLDQSVDVLVKAQTENFAASAGRSQSVAARARWVTIPLLGLTLAMCAAGLWVMRQVTRTLRHVASSLMSGADQVRAAAGQVAQSGQSLAQGTSEQAATLEETSSSTEEISSMARRNADDTRVAAELVTHSGMNFERTNQYLEQMVSAIGAINESSGKISKIIKVIDEIAFQTNILALNAAVEAARAGEAGMGFAVVADEVRNLAQRSAQAARETATLIEDSISKSGEGKAKVDDVAEAIGAITSEAQRVKELVDEVSRGSAEQARGIEQIGRAIAQMEQVTQTTAANAQESAAAAAELSSQADVMRDAVEELNSLVGMRAGGDSGPERGHNSARLRPVASRASVAQAKW